MKKTVIVFLLFCTFAAAAVFVRPVKYGAVRAVDTVLAGISEKQELIEQNAVLSARCDELEDKICSERKVFSENSELKKLMGIKLPGDKLTARVLNGNLKTRSAPFAVSKGAADGVSEGRCAVFSGGLAGVVTACGNTWAEITPLASADFSLSVTDCANGQVYLLKKNRLMYVSAQDNAAVGDIIATSGMSDSVPGGLKVGRISDIKKKNGGNVIVTIEPYVDVKELQYVIIPL